MSRGALLSRRTLLAELTRAAAQPKPIESEIHSPIENGTRGGGWRGTEPPAVPAAVDDVTVVHEAVDERPGQELVDKDLAPFREGALLLVRTQKARV